MSQITFFVTCFFCSANIFSFWVIYHLSVHSVTVAQWCLNTRLPRSYLQLNCIFPDGSSQAYKKRKVFCKNRYSVNSVNLRLLAAVTLELYCFALLKVRKRVCCWLLGTEPTCEGSQLYLVAEPPISSFLRSLN